MLSLLRVFISPLFFYFLISENPILIASSLFLFFIGALTDYFDGYLARKYEQVSSWGKFMDPLADKILTTGAFGGFVILEIMPLWMFIIFLMRDIGTTLLRVIAERNGMYIETSGTAKWKTFLQMFLIFYLLFLLFALHCDCNIFNKEFVENILFSDFTFTAFLLLTAYTIFTLTEYIVAFSKSLKNKN